MAKPQRSLRLERRSTRSLNTLSGSEGEIFYDTDQNALRVYVTNAGSSVTVADRTWVLDNSFSGSYNDLTDRPTAFANLDFIGLINGTTINEFSTDETLADSSDTAVPTENAVKTYVDSVIGSVDITSALDDLSDVIVTTPATNQVLRFDGTNWVNGTVQGFQDTNTEYSIGAATVTGGAYIQLVGTDSSLDYVKLQAGSNVSIDRLDPSTIQISSAVGSLALEDLSNVSTLTPATGQVLKWDGSAWAPAADATLGGAGLDADTLDGQDGTYYLNYNNFTNTPTIPSDLTDLGIVDGQSGYVLTTDGAGNFSFIESQGGSGTVGAMNDLQDVDTTGAIEGSVLKYDNATSTWVVGTDDTIANPFDQSLNTTDDVVFNSVSSSTFTNSGSGAPSITSASTITLDAPDGVSIGEFVQLPVLTAEPTTPTSGTVAVADGTTWDPAGTGTETMVVYLGGAWRTIANA